jgi:hypothetical protein
MDFFLLDCCFKILCVLLLKMDLSHFCAHFSKDQNIGQGIALYIIASKNLTPQFQKQNFVRCGVAGSREVANIDRSVTASGAASKASSLFSRTAMYLANNIQSMNLIACLILPPSVVSAPSGPTIARILEKRRDGDMRPDYALKGKTMAMALESVFHSELDDMPTISRARRQTEWFKTTQSNYKNIKLALQSVGHGIYYDFTRFPSTAMPNDFLGKGQKLSGGVVMNTTTHTFKTSPRLQELKRNLHVGDEVEGEDGVIRLNRDDIEDIRLSTRRGMFLLELITRKEKAQTSTQTGVTTTGSTATQTTTKKTIGSQIPMSVRMTRSAVNTLRNVETSMDEQRRRRVVRALAKLVS